jgi:hypothetical protein
MKSVRIKIFFIFILYNEFVELNGKEKDSETFNSSPLVYLASVKPMNGNNQDNIRRRAGAAMCDDSAIITRRFDDFGKSDIDEIYSLLVDIRDNIFRLTKQNNFHEIEENFRNAFKNSNDPIEDVIECGGFECPVETAACEIIENARIDSKDKRKLKTIVCLSNQNQILMQKRMVIDDEVSTRRNGGSDHLTSEQRNLEHRINKKISKLSEKIEEVFGKF